MRDYVRQFRFSAVLLAPQDARLALDAQVERVSEAEVQEIQAGLLMATNQRADAERAAARALALDPSRVRARVLSGVLQLNGGEVARAVDTLTAAAARAPGDASAQMRLGDALSTAGKWEDALQAYEKAVALNADVPEVHLSLSLARDATGNVAGADAAFAQVMRLDPDPAWFQRRAYVLMRRNRGEQAALDAVSYLRDVAWQTDSSPYLAFVAILGFRQAGRADDANSVLKIASTHVQSSSWQGALLGFLGGQITPAQLVAKAGNDDELTEAHAYAGLTASHAGRRDEAIVHLTWVKEKGNKSFYEYPLAVAELARLEAGKAAM